MVFGVDDEDPMFLNQKNIYESGKMGRDLDERVIGP